MNRILILAAILCVHDVIQAYTGDVNSTATTPIDDQNNLSTSGGRVKDATPTQESTGSRDVSRCTTIDDVTAVRRSLCPAQCKCSPLSGHEVLTTLTVDCSGGKFNQSTSSRLIFQELTRLLSRCSSNLKELTIFNTTLTTLPEVVCQLSKIQILTLDCNRLASLPSNCFTRMHNLVKFSASYNRLTSLQVRWRNND